jgi:RNA polymerase sigma factor (TIGR02999 family)
VTALLHAWRDGDPGAFAELVPLVYSELHRLAARQLRGERPDHTFRPTDLVNEAYLRLTHGAPPELSDRTHFFAIAARNMRQILIDHARRRSAGKRGAGVERIPLDDRMVAPDKTEELIAFDEALQALAAFDERKARVVELHYFAGLTHEEIATVEKLHFNTVARDLRLAVAWLHSHLHEST